jgi:hypothetical protein
VVDSCRCGGWGTALSSKAGMVTTVPDGKQIGLVWKREREQPCVGCL